MTQAMTKKMGRPSMFSQSLAANIVAMAAQGMTEEQIADKIGISRTTLKNWKGAHPDFLTAIKAAKDVANDMVEIAVFQRAVGYSHPALKIFCSEGAIVTEEYLEHHPPDIQAARFWLMNRRPKKWRDVQKLEISGSIKHELPSLSEAKLILDADYAALPATPVVVPDLDEGES